MEEEEEMKLDLGRTTGKLSEGEFRQDSATVTTAVVCSANLQISIGFFPTPNGRSCLAH